MRQASKQFKRITFLVTMALVLSATLVPTSALASEPDLQEATAACLMDSNGSVLYAMNAEEEMPMASITKVMTAMVALDSGIALSTPVSFVESEFSEDAQLTGYKTGDQPSLDELLRIMLVYSGNDAATNIAIAIAGSVENFSVLMNKKAAELNMTHTRFVNPHGLEEDGHYSCAYDLCVMGRYAMEHYPYIRDAVHTRYLEIAPGGVWITFESTDLLMDYYDGLLGIKTGATESGTSFLGAAERSLVTLYSCVLCCETGQGRFDDSERLLDWGFDLYAKETLARAGTLYRVAPWQDGFWLKCPVSAKYETTGAFRPETALDATSALRTANEYVPASTTYGTTIWTQESRHVESATYKTAERPRQVKAWNTFALPLFQDTESLAAS